MAIRQKIDERRSNTMTIIRTIKDKEHPYKLIDISFAEDGVVL